MDIRKIISALVPLAAGAALATGVSAVPAQAATVQFTATVQAPNRILTSQPLFTGEHLTVGLDGFKETVTSVQRNGGGTVAWLQYPLPKRHAPLTPVLFTVR